MDVVREDGASVHVLLAGTGQPSTVFIHGLAQSAADTRIFGSGIAGTRAFIDLRGHGGSTSADREPAANWKFSTLADDVDAVATELEATRALGVSAGASVLLALLAEEPTRFERVALVLPSSLDPRSDASLVVTDQLADAIGVNDQVEIARLLLLLQPVTARERIDVGLWARRQAAQLGGTPAGTAIRALPRVIAVSDFSKLGEVSADILLLAQRGDDAHPTSAALELAAYLPTSKVVVGDRPWIWGARQELRETLVRFFNS